MEKKHTKTIGAVSFPVNATKDLVYWLANLYMMLQIKCQNSQEIASCPEGHATL